MSISGEYPPMTVVEALSQSTYREDMDERGNEYARTGIATYTIVHRKRIRASKEGAMLVVSAKSFSGQGVGNMVGSGRENSKPRD